MGPIGSLHAGTVNRLTVTLVELLGRSAIVGVQNPLQLDLHNEPQPDISILASRDDYYTTGHPEPGDTLLVIEVSELFPGVRSPRKSAAIRPIDGP